MEILKNLEGGISNYLVTRESVSASLLRGVVLPYSERLREQIAPDYYPKFRHKVGAALAVGLVLSPIYLSGIDLSFSNGDNINLGVVAVLALGTSILGTSMSLRKRPV